MATFNTLLLVPVLYAIFVLDLKMVKWQDIHREHAHGDATSHLATEGGESGIVV